MKPPKTTQPTAADAVNSSVDSASFLGVALSAVLAKQRIKAVQLVERTAIPPSRISRLISGRQRFITPAVLELIARAATDSPVEQGEIIRGHLLDECPPYALEFVQILVNGVAAKPPSPLPAGALSKDGRRALNYLLRETTSNPSLEQHLIALAKLLGMK
jgi:DNA-binding Xre family transcriptional regulator